MQILNETEVAEMLRCTKAALRRWRREGRGPRFIRVGRLIRYRMPDVEEFLESNASSSRAASNASGQSQGQPKADLKADGDAGQALHISAKPSPMDLRLHRGNPVVLCGNAGLRNQAAEVERRGSV